MGVIPVNPKPNSLCNKSGSSNAFKTLSFVYKLYHILFAVDFGFFKIKSSKTKVFFRLLSFAQSVVLFYLCSKDFNIVENAKVFFFYTIYLIQYTTYVGLLLCQKTDRTFHSLLQDLQIIDIGLNVDSSSYYLEVKAVLAVLASVLVRGLLSLAYYSNGSCSLLFLYSIIFTLLVNCADFVHITFAFAFYSISCRMEKLILILETDADITSLLLIYKSLVDMAEAHKAAFDLLFLSSLVFYIPDAMVIIYYSVSELVTNNKTGLSIDLWMDYATVLVASVLTLCPALSAGILSLQANKLKVKLNDKILQEHDEGRIRVIELFISYVETRGCRFRVLKIIPLDADLLGMVVSFCATYLIVTIQFTH